MSSLTPMAAAIAALQSAERLAVLTGAGISAESGIPTFRDALTGLWANFDAQALATPQAFRADPGLVWGWYEWRRMKALQAQPNAAHLALAELARRVPHCPVITQNVDDLHERAGSREVLHLHGSLLAARCAACERPFSLPPGVPDEPEGGRHQAPPRCLHCGGLVRPGIVWFGETLPPRVWTAAEAAVRGCDALLVIGTSGVVYPAAGLADLARQRGKPVIVVNPDADETGEGGDIGLRGPAGTLLPTLVAQAMGTPPGQAV